MEIPTSKTTKPFIWRSVTKGGVLAIFAIALLAGSSCVNVDLNVRTSGGDGLTGTHCKLQRPLTNQHQQTNVWCWAAAAHTVIGYLKNEEIKQCEILQAVYRSELAYKWSQEPKATTATLDAPNCCMQMPEEYPGRDVKPKPENLEGGPENVETKAANVTIAEDICYDNNWPEAVFRTSEYSASSQIIAYNWSTPYLAQGLSWAELTQEICSDRPMIDIILYSRELGGGGHAVVIGGYSELEDGSQWVHVYDPGYNTEEDDSYLWPYDVYLGTSGVFTHVRDYTHISTR